LSVLITNGESTERLNGWLGDSTVEPQAESDSRIRRRTFVRRKSAEKKYGYSILSFLLFREIHINDNFHFIL